MYGREGNKGIVPSSFTCIERQKLVTKVGDSSAVGDEGK